MKKILGIALVGAAALAMTACGSDDNDGAPVTAAPAGSVSDIPASALQNSAGLNAYLEQQIAASSDTGEPVLVGDSTTLPNDDTTETSL